MSQLRENVRSLSIQLKGIDPFRGETQETEQSKSQNPLAGLQASIIQFEVDQEVLAAHIKAEEEKQANQKPEVDASEIEKLVVQDARYLTLLAHIEKAKLRQADYEKTGKNLASNPLYKQLQSDLSDSTQALEKLKVDLRNEFKETVEKRLAMHNADQLNAMKREYASNQARLKVFQEKFKKNIGSAQEYTGDNLELEFRRSKLEQVTKIHDEIQLRILGITTEQRAPARVELFKEAVLPAHPDELAPWKKIGMGAGAAFFVPFALVIAWEQFFRRVTGRNQLETFQRISVVGEITSLPTQLRGTSSTNRNSAREVSLFEESVDGLRTYLTLAESLRDLRILAVTSASSNEGKTSLATQLAVSIAKACGERILLIDGDMRAPDIHAIFDFDLSPGLAEVLSNDCPLEEAIETGFSDKLHILTAGRLTSSPHQLLGNHEFSELLEKLCSIYRYIIVDTPPILPASEALVMARAADAAVLCVRRDFSRLDQVEEACRRMAAAGVRNAGAVLNGIPIKSYAYKYGSYAYSSPTRA
jgi:capsular exopolysaccharide synthesis family protein